MSIVTTTDSAATSRGPTTQALLRVVDLARLAPSIQNTQPWHWAIGEGSLDLWADRSRWLPAKDPVGRHLTISCGTALHHAVVAARALGLGPVLDHVADPDHPDLLARIDLQPGGRPPPSAAADVAALRSRSTDRRRFTRWPVPDERVRDLVGRVEISGARAVAVTGTRHRRGLERAIERGHLGGVPCCQGPDSATPPLPGSVAEPGTDLVATDGLVVIGTEGDDEMARLGAGQTLSALWLQATEEGLSVVPLCEPVEHEAAREALRTALRADLSASHLEPQILVRLGWQEIGRSALLRTPRRPVADLLRTPRDIGPRTPGQESTAPDGEGPPTAAAHPGLFGTSDPRTPPNVWSG